MKNNLTRREFVMGTTGAATAAMILPRHVLGGTGYVAPNDKLNVAVTRLTGTSLVNSICPHFSTDFSTYYGWLG